MALLLTPTQPTFLTSYFLTTAQAYVRISKLEYDKVEKTVTLHLEYFTSEAAAKNLIPALPFELLGLPTQVVCDNPLELLADALGKSTFIVAYEYVSNTIQLALGGAGTVTSAM